MSSWPRSAVYLLALCCACGMAGSPSLPASRESALEIARGQAGEPRHFPFAFDAPGGNVVVSYSEHVDAVIENPVDASTLVGPDITSRGRYFYLTGMAQVHRVLVATSYIAVALDPLREWTYGWVSRDGGASWVTRPGILTLPEPGKHREARWGGFLFHRRMHAMPDGSMQGTMYGNYAHDPDWYSTIWVRSADLGATWQVVSTVAAGEAGQEGYGEPVSAVCPDGSILVVMRTGHNTPMRWSRSRDGGRNWSQARELPFIGWDPDLLLSAGSLVLTYGTPDRGPGQPARAWLVKSTSCGESWGPVRELSHIPTSSGYTGLAHLRGRLTLFTDTDNETAIRGYSIEGI